MKKLFTLTLVTVLVLSTIGCEDTSTTTSTSSTPSNSDSTQTIASYTTVWNDNASSVSYYYDTRYSVTSVPFEGITYEPANSNFNGPLSSTADINYVGTANVQDKAYLTHWPDGTSTYSCKPFDGVTYRSRTVYNQDDDIYSYSYYESYVLYEGTALAGSRSDFELDGEIYVDKTLVDNDGVVRRQDSIVE